MSHYAAAQSQSLILGDFKEKIQCKVQHISDHGLTDNAAFLVRLRWISLASLHLTRRSTQLFCGPFCMNYDASYPTIGDL